MEYYHTMIRREGLTRKSMYFDHQTLVSTNLINVVSLTFYDFYSRTQ